MGGRGRSRRRKGEDKENNTNSQEYLNIVEKMLTTQDDKKII